MRGAGAGIEGKDRTTGKGIEDFEGEDMWYEIKGFPRYEVSDDGKVRSKPREWRNGNGLKRAPAHVMAMHGGFYYLRAGNGTNVKKIRPESLMDLREGEGRED